MSVVTTLRLESGDRQRLDSVVDELCTTAQQKGAELNGPHSYPPTERTVPLYADIDDDAYTTWEYTTYHRELSVVGHDTLAKELAQWSFPTAVHVELELSPLGQ